MSATTTECPWTKGLQEGRIGVRLSLQLKLRKHLQAENHERVADYLQMVRRALPEQKFSNVIDPEIAAAAVTMLKTRGYKAAMWSDGKYRIWLPK